MTVWASCDLFGALFYFLSYLRTWSPSLHISVDAFSSCKHIDLQFDHHESLAHFRWISCAYAINILFGKVMLSWWLRRWCHFASFCVTIEPSSVFRSTSQFVRKNLWKTTGENGWRSWHMSIHFTCSDAFRCCEQIVVFCWILLSYCFNQSDRQHKSVTKVLLCVTVSWKIRHLPYSLFQSWWISGKLVQEAIIQVYAVPPKFCKFYFGGSQAKSGNRTGRCYHYNPAEMKFAEAHIKQCSI